MNLNNPVSLVAIIGGGFTGTAVAFHLAANPTLGSSSIVVFEPRENLGGGLAYDTQDPAHRINVPATRMSLLPDDDEHFFRWLKDNHDPSADSAALTADGRLFPRRGVFGRYVANYLKDDLDKGRIRHEQHRVVGVTRHRERWRIVDEEGRVFMADIVVIATTHPPPQPPAGIERALSGHPRYVRDATRPDALAVVRPDDRVLVVGNGLTSADVIASLRARGHRGPITALSRRGLRSRGHATLPQEPFGDFLQPSHPTARSLLRAVRTAIDAAERQGISWHAVLDAVRAQAGDIWRQFPVSEKRRLVRHLRAYWDVHRFRIAPQVEEALDAAVADGSLRILAGRIIDLEQQANVIACTIRYRRSSEEVRSFHDAVIVTTGPSHASILSWQPWLRELSDTGLVCLDPIGLGLACSERSQALGRDGIALDSLFIAGPLARGTFGELMGLPQVSQHAATVAAQVAQVIVG